MDDKIKYSLDLIERALANARTPCVSTSFGKDSQVVTHLVTQVAGTTVPLFNLDTGIEFPEVEKFRDEFVAKHGYKLLIQPAFPENYWGLVEKYGFPLGQRGFEDDPDHPTNKCCYYLKKKPLHRAIKKFGFDLQFLGLRAVESKLRAVVRKNFGDYYWNKRHKVMECHPILNWTDKELYQYIEKYNVELNPLYYKPHPTIPNYKIRTGCWACPQGWKSGKGIWLKHYYPGFYKTLMKKGLAKEIAQLKLGDGVTDEMVRDLLETRPCFFEEL
jgi:3'-phosphoadenosine 5'-phosphosulfate sulfotransferase (PAPS reductase)/FAD synthetase